ncbi:MULTISPECIES: hypothetical protein [Sulfurimonas]|uniref:hypothetical protein n=1 Tax=Sulfurimonas TaxID=202746 RepID=UPI001264D85F|nr:hypothetical protein [Sulfurimonas indica]
MKKSFVLLLLLGIFLQLFATDSKKLTTQEFPQTELKKQKMQIASMVAKELSKNLPQKIDTYTSLISITNEDATLVYTFEINSGAKSDAAIIKEDHSRMQRAVTKGVCRSSSRFLEAGINTRYIYRSAKSKKRLFVFNITQAQCEKSQL